MDLPTSSTKLDTNDHRRDDGIDPEIVEFPLPGFRFHPTDEELVGFYLKRKVLDERLDDRIDQLIKQVDIYKYDPWDLQKYFGDVGEIGHKEWYFFCKRGRKYKNSIRPNRVTGSGFWKATGIDRQIMGSYEVGLDHPQTYECIGLKKSLVYYRGNAGKGVKTDWMMHEFRLPSNSSAAGGHDDDHHLLPQEAEVWTLCRILKRDVPHHKYTHANLIELGNLKDSMKPIDNNNSCNNKSFISFTSPTTLIKPDLAPYHHHHHHHQISDHDNPSDPSYTDYYNSPEMDHDDGTQCMIKYANWDELRHVVECFDPYHL